MIPRSLAQLTEYFEKFPGIGPRQAGRFSFFLMKQPPDVIDKFIQALTSLKNEVKMCSTCYMPMDSNQKFCSICSDDGRDKNSVLIVEKESDAINMEKIGHYRGTYLILGENISPIHDSQIVKKRIRTFLKKLSEMNSVRGREDSRRASTSNEMKKTEVILALNNTREGNFTLLYMQEALKKTGVPNIKITRLGRGLSTGSELEYADEETLRNALEGRK